MLQFTIAWHTWISVSNDTSYNDYLLKKLIVITNVMLLQFFYMKFSYTVLNLWLTYVEVGNVLMYEIHI